MLNNGPYGQVIVDFKKDSNTPRPYDFDNYSTLILNYHHDTTLMFQYSKYFTPGHVRNKPNSHLLATLGTHVLPFGSYTFPAVW